MKFPIGKNTDGTSVALEIEGNILEWAFENATTEEIKEFGENYVDVWFGCGLFKNPRISSRAFFFEEGCDDVELESKGLFEALKDRFENTWDDEEKEDLTGMYIAALENDLAALKQLLDVHNRSKPAAAPDHPRT